MPFNPIPSVERTVTASESGDRDTCLQCHVAETANVFSRGSTNITLNFNIRNENPIFSDHMSIRADSLHPTLASFLNKLGCSVSGENGEAPNFRFGRDGSGDSDDGNDRNQHGRTDGCECGNGRADGPGSDRRDRDPDASANAVAVKPSGNGKADAKAHAVPRSKAPAGAEFGAAAAVPKPATPIPTCASAASAKAKSGEPTTTTAVPPRDGKDKSGSGSGNPKRFNFQLKSRSKSTQPLKRSKNISSTSFRDVDAAAETEG